MHIAAVIYRNHITAVTSVRFVSILKFWSKVGACILITVQVLKYERLLYIFSNAKQFITGAEEMIKQNIRVKEEFFISEVYNILLKSGKKFVVDIADEFIPFGTPDDIKKFER